MDIYWPGLIVLFYVLIGLGYTIMGFYALGAWMRRRREAQEEAQR
jgi:hypothetical protein